MEVLESCVLGLAEIENTTNHLKSSAAAWFLWSDGANLFQHDRANEDSTKDAKVHVAESNEKIQTHTLVERDDGLNYLAAILTRSSVSQMSSVYVYSLSGTSSARIAKIPLRARFKGITWMTSSATDTFCLYGGTRLIVCQVSRSKEAKGVQGFNLVSDQVPGLECCVLGEQVSLTFMWSFNLTAAISYVDFFDFNSSSGASKQICLFAALVSAGFEAFEWEIPEKHGLAGVAWESSHARKGIMDSSMHTLHALHHGTSSHFFIGLSEGLISIPSMRGVYKDDKASPAITVTAKEVRNWSRGRGPAADVTTSSIKGWSLLSQSGKDKQSSKVDISPAISFGENDDDIVHLSAPNKPSLPSPFQSLFNIKEFTSPSDSVIQQMLGDTNQRAQIVLFSMHHRGVAESNDAESFTQVVGVSCEGVATAIVSAVCPSK